MMRWYQRLFRRARTERQLDAELRFHLDQRIADYVASGMTPAEARQRARLEFGGLDQVKEECRDIGAARFIETLIQDVRYGLRQLRRNPGFTAVAVITLALGIGATTAIFSVVNTVLLLPLPYKDPGRLAVLWTDNVRKNLHEERVSYPNFEDWKAQNRTFEDLAFCSVLTVNLAGGDQPERVVAERTTPNLFPLLGVSPVLGRTFTAEDVRRGNRVVVLSYGFWRRQVGGSKQVLGRLLEIDGVPAEVIGVMPPTLRSPDNLGKVQFWELNNMFRGWDVIKNKRAIPSGYAVGRLKPNVTFAQAQADMSTVAKRLAREYPDLAGNIDFFGFSVNVVPLNLQVTGHRVRLELWLLFGAAVLVLLIACTNVANLLLSQGSSRARELAVRAALGAGRGRLVRQLLTEAVLLFLVSAALGVALASVGTTVLTRLAPPDIARLNQVAIDRTVLFFAIGLSVLTAILFGLAPAFKVSKRDAEGSLRDSGRGLSGGASVRRTHGLLTISEYALAFVLVASAGLLIRSLLQVQSVSPGFRPERVLIVRVVQSAIKPRSQWAELWPQALQRIDSIPGVKAAAAIDNFFFSSNPDDTIIPEGASRALSEAATTQVMDDGISPDYFRAIGVPLIKGRYFSESDGPRSPRVAIVDQTLARRFWPNEDPIGKRFRFSWDQPTDPWVSVVGLVGDMHRDGLAKTPVSQVFLPLPQDPARGMDLVVRSISNPLQLAGAARSAIWSIDRTAPVFGISTLDEQLHEQTAPRRFETVLLSVFAALAVVLAAVGIYGITHYSVNQRTHEIGIRMALGAQVGDVLVMVLRQGLALALGGTTIGLLGALWLTQFLSGLLYGVKRTDPLTFAAASLVLTGIALLACYVPARRATKVDPMVALRHE
jgi:predicted permease